MLRSRCIFIWRLQSEMTERIHDRLSSINAAAVTDYTSPTLRLHFATFCFFRMPAVVLLFCFWCFIWIFLNTLLCLLSVFVCLRALLCYKLFVILDFDAAYIWCGMCSRRETFYVSDKKPVRDSNDNVTPACAAATVPQTPEALSPQLDYRFSVGQLPSWAKRQVSQLSGRQKFV